MEDNEKQVIEQSKKAYAKGFAAQAEAMGLSEKQSKDFFKKAHDRRVTLTSEDFQKSYGERTSKIASAIVEEYEASKS